MINRLKQIKITRKGIYIALAISMLLVGGIGIFAAVRNMGKMVDESQLVNNDPINEPIDIGTVVKPPEKDVSEPVIKEEEPVILDFIMPVAGEINKGYSNSELVYSQTMNDYRTHMGIDIMASEGTSVTSAESGTIVSVEDHPLWGTTVHVEHANGFVTCYRNLSDELPVGIEEGSFVTAGGIIGSVGATALVEIGEAPHLHFEMYVNGSTVDPLEYIS